MENVTPVRVGALNDEQLHEHFVEVGRTHRRAARCLIGMLGELQRRGIAERKGFTSISEYAKVTAGLTNSQIELGFRLDRATAQLPCLRELLQNGTVSTHRLRVLVGIATPAMDRELASLAVRLSKSQLEGWVRDWRAAQPGGGRADEGSVRPGEIAGGGAVATEAAVAAPVAAAATRGGAPVAVGASGVPAATSVCGSSANAVAVEISPIIYQRLVHEQARLAGQRGRPVSMNELMVHLLDGDDRSRSRYVPVVVLSTTGDVIGLRTQRGTVPLTQDDVEELKPACAPIELDSPPPATEPSDERRHRPVAIDRYVLARSGGTCEAPGCGRPGTGMHHWVPWALSKRHDVNELSMLCPLHLDLGDRGLLERSDEGEWTVLAQSRAAGPVREIQQLYEQRREADY